MRTLLRLWYLHRMRWHLRHVEYFRSHIDDATEAIKEHSSEAEYYQHKLARI